MAFANDTRTALHGLKLDPGAIVHALMARLSDYRAYRRTVAELSELNAYELADLGLNRADVRAAAREAVYGKRT